MITSIHQPDYIPWLGFYHKVAHSDIFVWLDDAQYSNEAAHNFNVIKTPQGEYRLKIPVEYSFGDAINKVRTRDELGWKQKHLKTLAANYSRAKYFPEIYPRISDVYNSEYTNIAEFNMALNGFLFDGFSIKPKILKSSELNTDGVREARVIDICVSTGADTYLSGNGARVYQNASHFAEKGIELTYSTYKPISYPQLWGDFLPCMSVLDYVFNCGFDFEYVERAVSKD